MPGLPIQPPEPTGPGRAPVSRRGQGRVLDTTLELTDYEELTLACQAGARREGTTAVEFANTQIVVMRRHEAEYRRLSSCYDYFIPDGMPLIWRLNRQGAGLRDRVYGPAFMRHCLLRSPEPFTHYLLGGSAECGARLRAVFDRENPRIRFVGAYHGSVAGPEGGARLVEEINRLSPDFIWVGLGTPKQDRWIFEHRPKLRRGVILAVGFAFDVNAGTKPDAPPWMQRAGLTWLHRLGSEPLRLGPRYVRYNSLFLYYLLRDGLFEKSTMGVANASAGKRG